MGWQPLHLLKSFSSSRLERLVNANIPEPNHTGKWTERKGKGWGASRQPLVMRWCWRVSSIHRSLMPSEREQVCPAHHFVNLSSETETRTKQAATKPLFVLWSENEFIEQTSKEKSLVHNCDLQDYGGDSPGHHTRIVNKTFNGNKQI